MLVDGGSEFAGGLTELIERRGEREHVGHVGHRQTLRPVRTRGAVGADQIVRDVVQCLSTAGVFEVLGEAAYGLTDLLQSLLGDGLAR